jgi:hypothetical protein
MPDAHEPPETASGWELDEGVTKKLPPEDWLDELSDDLLEVVDELPDPEEP